MADPLYREHDPGPVHPESPRRFDAACEGIRRVEAVRPLTFLPARDATEADLLACHSADYLEQVRRDVTSDVMCLSTGDTDICPCSYEVALRAAGGVLAAVDAVMVGRVANAFCAVRPPGHHATSDRGMGFCIFNNVAIAARYAQRVHGIRRVAILDWDVHHGNGTQEMFYEDPSVFFFSTHQWPCYPGTGRALEQGLGPGKHTTLNCPFPPGSGRVEILGAFEQHLVPALRQFRPELVLLSAGFDGRIGDPVGNFMLTDDDYADLTRLVMGMAAAHASGRLVSVLEGGYDPDGLASAVASHVGVLAAGR